MGLVSFLTNTGTVLTSMRILTKEHEPYGFSHRSWSYVMIFQTFFYFLKG